MCVRSPPSLPPPHVVPILAPDDTLPELHVVYFRTSMNMRQRLKKRVRAYCLNTSKSALSITNEEPPVCVEDDRPSEGTWVEEAEEEMPVIRMGPVSWITAQILPQYRDQQATPTVELKMFEDAVNRVSPYVELASAACNADFQKILNDVRSE